MRTEEQRYMEDGTSIDWEDIQRRIWDEDDDNLERMERTLTEARNDWTALGDTDWSWTLRQWRYLIRRELEQRFKEDQLFHTRDCPHFDMG